MISLDPLFTAVNVWKFWPLVKKHNIPAYFIHLIIKLVHKDPVDYE